MAASARSGLLWLGLLCGLTGLSPMATSAPRSPTGEVWLLDIKGGIGPATSVYVQRGLTQAAAAEARAVVLRIDTPGGLDAATRDINQAVLASSVPVLAWVAPEGARAASAGTYLVYASHLAAMAPATSLGAATPVAIGSIGSDGEPETTPTADEDAAKQAEQPRKTRPGSAMARKSVNDSTAYLRTLAELRGRDLAFAEAAVRDAATLTAQQALAAGVIEVIAANLDDLLNQAHGRVVRGHAGPRVLNTRNAPVRVLRPDWRSRVLSVITEPSVAYLLLLIGLYGLIFEGYSPGAVLPGVAGAICLLLALYALQVLPVNYAGVALIVLGIGLMTAELMLPSFGTLGIGGLIALLVGSLMLFETDVPGFGVPGQLILGIGVGSSLLFLGSIWLALRARRRPVVTGIDELLGQTAQVLADFHGHGQVLIRGENWAAHCASPLHRGQPVRVIAVEGLCLQVIPLPQNPSLLPEKPP